MLKRLLTTLHWVAFACYFSWVAQAMADTPIAVDVPPGELVPALEQLERQASVELIFRSSELKGLQTRGVKGTYEPKEAIRLLLKGTPLELKVDPSGALLIARPRPGQQPDAGRDPVKASDAQTPHPDDTAALEEIVVTAQKREERLVDVPISIVAVGSDELRRRRISSVDELAFVVPGLSAQNDGLDHRLTLRGISNFAGSVSPLIGTYLDEASVTTVNNPQVNLSVFDLERVEVLRGPQGTLYGEGSAGGTIRFITRSPVLDHFELDSNLAASFSQYGAPGQRVDTALNIPLLTDELGLRLSGLFEHDGGWIDQPAADRKNINEHDLVDVRARLLWRPTTAFTAGVLAEIHRNDGGSNHNEDQNGNYTQVFNLTTTPSVQDNYDIYNLTLTYDFANMRLLSTTSYLKQSDVTRNYGYSLPFAPNAAPAVPFSVLEVDSFFTPRISNFADELRLTSTASGPWQWTVGASARRMKYDFNLNYYFDFAPAPLPATVTPDVYSTLSKSYAVFGDTHYALTSRLTVGAGARYFEDHQDFTSGIQSQSARFHATTPRGYIELKITDDSNIYASAAKGFRSGGFNNQPGQPTYGPEYVSTYEIGNKSLLLGRRLRTDVALFYSTYNDFQVLGQQLAPPYLNLTTNGGSARVKGVEWAIDWAATDRWHLGLNGDYLDAFFHSVAVGSADHLAGDPLDLVARYMVGVTAQRDFSWNGHPGFVRLDYDQQGPQSFRLRSIGPFFYSESDVLHVLNGRVSLEWSDALSLAVFGQNLLNNRGHIDPLAIEYSAARERPRTLGIELNMKLD